jgi:putative sterol carrier protein
MKDTTVLARCNLYAVLGAIPHLLILSPEAAALVAGKNLKVGFSIKNGPKATLIFRNGQAEMVKGTDGCSIKLWFPSPEKFNAMIDGKASPLPVSGFHHIGFLLGAFTKLTDILSSYLRPDPEKLADPVFFERSTTLMLYVIGRAIVQIGNHDKVGKFSASNVTDGKIKLGIGDDLAVAIHAKGGKLSFNAKPTEGGYTSQMVFGSLKTARDLFDGNINAIAAVGMGQVRIGGMVSQVDNINRILDRVAIYLA